MIYRCRIHGPLRANNAWVDANNVVICSKCGAKGESVVLNGSTDISKPLEALKNER